MTPDQKLKQLIVNKAIEFGSQVDPTLGPDDAYDYVVEHDEHWDAESEVRGGEVETDIPCERDRHYESKSVAAKAPDGTWIGWTYWYGGGKHGEPEGVPWIDEAYDLDCKEEEKLVVVRTFTKA